MEDPPPFRPPTKRGILSFLEELYCWITKGNIRASIISFNYLTTSIKIIYLCLFGGEKRRENISALLCKS
jgi:hypothetical protein